METKKLLTAALIASMSMLNAPSVQAADITERKVISAGETETYTGKTITVSGQYEGNGGAVHNSGTFNVLNSSFVSNSASANGGAIYNAAGGIVNLGDNVLIQGNKAQLGAGIYNAGTLNIGSNVTFKNNQLAGAGELHGSAVENYYGGTVTIGDYLTITNDSPFDTDCCFIHNSYSGSVTIGDYASFSNTSGDGILSSDDWNTGRPQLQLGSNASFKNIQGAAVLNWYKADAVIGDNAEFDNAGAAIMNIQNSTVVIGDGVVIKNSYKQNRGAIYNSSAHYIGASDNTTSITFNGSASIQDNTTYGLFNRTGADVIFKGAAAFSNNIVSFDGALDGGAVRNVKDTDADVTSLITFKSTSSALFENNSSIANGGAVYNDSSIIFEDGSSAVFNENTAVNGGAVYNAGSMTLADAVFTDNSASASGGAVYNSGSMLIKAANNAVTFSGNKAAGSANDIYNTGALTLNAALGKTITLSGGISGNAGTVNITGAGAVNIGSNLSYQTVNLSSGALNLGDNTAADTLRIIAASGAELTSGNGAVFQNGSITGENAYGGAVYNKTGGTAAFGENTKFNDNSAYMKGGAVYNAGTMTIGSGSVFSNNTTSWDGAAGSGPEDTNSNGGAVWNSGTLTMGDNITFLNNHASSNVTSGHGHGSDIYNYGGALTIGDNLKITRDDNYEYFGKHDCAIFVNDGALNIGDNAEISNVNEAIVTSGSADVNIGDNLYIHDTANGIASWGRDVVIGENAVFENIIGSARVFQTVTAAGSFNFGDGLIVRNNTTTTFGNVYNEQGGASMTFGSAEFINNKAPLANAGLFQNWSNLTFNGAASFSGNMTKNDAGALRNRGAASNTVFNDTALFTGNAAAGSGGAAANEGVLVFNDSAVFTGNIAGGIQDYIEDENGIFVSNGTRYSWTITDVNTSSDAKGGAIYNTNALTFAKSAEFTGNKAGYGGAVYNSGAINFNSNALFSSNTANSAGNDIYNTGIINFNAADGVTNKIRLEGGIDGVISGIINIAGTGENKTGAADIQGSIHNQTVNVNSGTLHLSSGSADGSNLTGSTVSVSSGAVINTIDGLINTYNQTGSLITLSSGAKAKLEADLASGTADCFASSGGTVYVNSLNVLSDFTSGSKTLNIADTGTNINIDAIASADAEGVRRLYTTGGIYKIKGGDGVINVNFLDTGGINAAVESTTKEGAVQTISYSMTGTEYYNSDATDDTTVQKAVFTIEGNGNTIQALPGTLGLKNDGNSTLTINNAEFTNFTDADGAVENEAGGKLNLNNVVIGESNTAGIGNAGTLNAENSIISEVSNTGTANFNEGTILSAVNNKAGGTANLNSGAIAAAIENEAGGALNINEGASAGAVINEGALTIKIVDYVNEAQTVNTMISNASGDDTSGSTAIDLQLSDHSALESDGVEWNLGSNGLNQKYLTFTGDGHLILTGGDITAESITNKMTGNTLVIDSIEVHGNVENISTGHMALTNGSYTEGSIKNDGTFDIYNGTFTVSSNGIADAAQTGAAGILNIGNGLDSTAVSLAEGGSIVQNALNISNAASLTSKLSALTIGSGDINNAGTLTLTDNGAGALNYNLLGASGRTVFNIGSDNTIAYDMTSKTITNAIELQSGTFKASNGTSGDIDLSSAAGITAKGGVLNVQDGNFGTIKLGSLDTSSSALNVEMDLDWTVLGAADVLSADITGDKGINVSSFTLKNDADIAASSILIADDTIDTSKISVGSASVKNNTTVNGLALSTSYTAGTGTSLVFTVNTLKDAIETMTGARTYSIVSDTALDNSAGTMVLNGSALSISAGGSTLTAASADNNGISIASGQTLSIDNASITGFTNSTAIENAGTLNLDTVTFTGNKTDIDNTGELNVINSVTASVNNAGSISGAGILNLAGNSTNTGSIASAVSMAADSTLISSGNISGNINNTSSGALTISGGNVSGSIDISNNTAAMPLFIQGGNVSGNITNDNSSLTLYGGSVTGNITGSAGNKGTVDVVGNGVISGTMTYQDITVNNGAVLTPLGNALASSTNTLDLKNNSILNLADGGFSIINTPIKNDPSDVSHIILDVNPVTGASDKFSDASNFKGFVNIKDVKLTGELPESAYNGTSINISQSMGIGASHFAPSVLNGTLLTPIRYLQGSISQGMLNYVPTGGRNDYESFNPAVVSSAAAAQAGGYLVQLNSYDNAFANVDMFMLMPQEQRQAYRFKNKYAASDSNLVFDPQMKMQEKKALWVRPFASFENVPLKNGPKVHNNIYGTFIGGDSLLYDLGRGWDGMFSVYAAYNGSHQSYNGISMYQNGGTLGVMGAAYKNNFFAAATVNAGANAADASTQYGSEDFAMLTAGAAVKTGYNYELFGGKFIIQPNMQASYSFVNTFNYTNAAGVRIKSDPLHAVQLEPGIKFIGNLKHGWQPYAGVSVVWNILDESNVKANDVSLPEMSVKPYVKYGIGVRKTWGERFTGFLQAGFTSGGRNGAGFQFGFRWALGR